MHETDMCYRFIFRTPKQQIYRQKYKVHRNDNIIKTMGRST